MPEIDHSSAIDAEGVNRDRNTGPPRASISSFSQVRLLIMVEGVNDIEFLKRLSRLLHRDDSSVPDLASLENDNAVLFIPVGGSDLPVWARRFSALHLAEYHLYDRDVAPATAARLETVDAINTRHNARAALTGKRQMENYLHAAAIHEARGIHISVSDDNDVADIAAHAYYSPVEDQPSWEALSHRARKRMRYQAKRWLNRDAVDRMTIARLEERDAAAEVRSWLSTIAEMLK